MTQHNGTSSRNNTWRVLAEPDELGGEELTPSEVADTERREAPRWVWSGTSTSYPRLLAGRVRIARCHDLAATERLLLGHEQRWPELAALGSLGGLNDTSARSSEPTLFDDPPEPSEVTARSGSDGDSAPSVPAPNDLVAQYQDQLRRIAVAASEHPGFPLLVAAESACWLAAIEMGSVGLPWDVGVHDELLSELLGSRPRYGRPELLNRLAAELSDVLEDPGVNPDSAPDLLRSLRRAGLPVNSTSRHELARHDHPAVPLVRRYKELARLWSANGWAWADTWVQDGRFHPEYYPAGVVSGRWATHGGGALQIPKALRAAVRAPAGRVLIVADAGQVEPRVLAAMSGDAGMIAATQAGDLYRELARRALGDEGRRGEAKIALLSAMYGGGTGSPALAALQRRFPVALAALEAAARRGEDGKGLHSILGRACPLAREGWLDGLSDEAARARSRARGRFTRNYLVQASAADWAAVLLAGLRSRLIALGASSTGAVAELVFFQHDEVIVEADPEQLDAVLCAIAEAGADATRRVLGDVGVQIPLDAAPVRSYAEKA